jgi:hypothetical protein
MKKFTILANCQSTSIAQALLSHQDFKDNFEYTLIPPIHVIDKQKDIHILTDLHNVDLLIYQPIFDKQRFGPFTSESIVSHLKQGAVSLCIPSMYYTGYFPTQADFNGAESTLRGVHEYLIMAAYLAGFDQNKTYDLLINSFPLNTQEIRQHHNLSVAALRNREKELNVDIKISDYINSTYQHQKLFHTFNHPTTTLIDYVSNNILESISIKCGQTNSSKDLLNQIVAPIYPSIVESLNLKFEQTPVSNQGNVLKLKSIVENDYEIYSRIDTNRLLASLTHKKRFLSKMFSL